MVVGIVLLICLGFVLPLLATPIGWISAVVGRHFRWVRKFGVAVALSGFSCFAVQVLVWGTFLLVKSDDNGKVGGDVLQLEVYAAIVASVVCGVFLALVHYAMLLGLVVALLVVIVKKVRSE